MERPHLPIRSVVRADRGAPRLFVNDVPLSPWAAWSWSFAKSQANFNDMAIPIMHPAISFSIAWPSPDQPISMAPILRVLETIHARSPSAYLLPRLLLDVPPWWKIRYADQLVEGALDLDASGLRTAFRDHIINEEGGWPWGMVLDQPSPFSAPWRSLMRRMLRQCISDIAEHEQLRKVVIGYQIGAGIHGEWHYPNAFSLPDTSLPARQVVGTPPALEARRQSSFGLFRDPSVEASLIRWYERLHKGWTAALLEFCALAKQACDRNLVIGAFYGYQLENVWFQEGSHLYPEDVLTSEDIDFLASPYSYQNTNVPHLPWYHHDVVDDFGHWFGRARGVSGDAGYRVLVESLRRHGKLYFVEIDSGTHLEPEPTPIRDSLADQVAGELSYMGGVGSTTAEGALRVLARDIGQVWARGVGGWLFDFGPILRRQASWYDDEDLRTLVRGLSERLERRQVADLTPVAEVAFVYDARAALYTRHWHGSKPYLRGSRDLDVFSMRHLDTQARALHRMGTPVDTLYRFDLEADDFAHRYRLIVMANTVAMSPQDVEQIHAQLRGSGVTVVWLYAAGLIREGASPRLDVSQMERLTGFSFAVARGVTEPPYQRLTDAALAWVYPDDLSCPPAGVATTPTSRPDPRFFGMHKTHNEVDNPTDVHEDHSHRGVTQPGAAAAGHAETLPPLDPRFTVIEAPGVEAWAHWWSPATLGGIAMARKAMDGWTSVYAGAAPLPPHVLRALARSAGAQLASSKPDIVVATRETCMLVASSDGLRELFGTSVETSFGEVIFRDGPRTA